MIYHPLSPFKGQHYKYPVESIDIYPTVMDLLQVPFDHKKHCTDPASKIVQKCTPLQGKSLAPVVLGNHWVADLKKKQASQSRKESSNVNSHTRHLLQEQQPKYPSAGKHGHGHGPGHSHNLGRGGKHKSSPVYTVANDVQFSQDFAVTQFWRCLDKKDFHKIHMDTGIVSNVNDGGGPIFNDCNMDQTNYNTDTVAKKSLDNLMLMGYSMRTIDYRYTAWIHFNSSTLRPVGTGLDDQNRVIIPQFEELYSHHLNNVLGNHDCFDFTFSELDNLATLQTRFPPPLGDDPESDDVISTRATIERYRRRLLSFIHNRIVYSGRH